MSSDLVASTLRRLNRAATAVLNGFPVTSWSDNGGKSLLLDGAGVFTPLQLPSARTYHLTSQLDVPASVHGVRLKGEPLVATLFCLYPARIDFNGTAIFSDDFPPVASGPALFTVVPRLLAGRNGRLRMSLRIPAQQTANWCRLHFTTPSLRRLHQQIDLTWAQLALADAVAVTPAERRVVERAAAQVPARLLPAGPGRVADLHRALQPLAEKIRRLRVHIISHSHIDMNWLWTWKDTVEVARRDYKSVLAMMDDYPELTFSHSQAVLYQVFQKLEPADFQRILAHIRSGRWEPLTMNWVEGDTNMASGEATARQFVEAVGFSRTRLAAKPVGLHAPDTFGHAANLPQFAQSAGTEFYYHSRCNPGGANPWPVYWWEGQDGTRLLTLSTPVCNGDLYPSEIAKAAIRAHRFGHRAALHFHGVGDHGGGPARQSLDLLRQLQHDRIFPHVFCSTLQSYAGEIRRSGAQLPVHRGELNALFEGCYTTHADAKRCNRQGENLLATADTLSSLAGMDCGTALRTAWRKVLFHQFHDILPGSAIHESYAQTRRDHAVVAKTARRVTREALGVLQSGVRRGAIAVTNPLGFDRTDWVTVAELRGRGHTLLVDEAGREVIGQFTADGLGFLATVPAFGTAGYRVVRRISPPAAGLMVPQPSYAPNHVRDAGVLTNNVTQPLYFKVETEHFRVFVRRDSGIITEFFDKRVQRELIGFGMRRGTDYIDLARADLAFNVFQLQEEPPHRMSAWQILEVHREQSLLSGARTRVIETGAERCVIEVVHRLRRSLIRQHIIFHRRLPRVDFRTFIDWRESGDRRRGIPNLKVGFTARLPACEAWFEAPFCAVQRPADGQESVALRWAGVGGPDYGFAVLNDSKHGYDALGSRLRLTLLRSSYEPDAIPDLGRHRIDFALYPHPGDWRSARVVEAGTAFNQPLLATVSRSPGRQSVRGFTPVLRRSAGVQLATLKAAQDSTGTVIRLYESTGRGARVILAGLPARARVWVSTLLEEPQKSLSVRRGHCTLTFRPWQIRTLLVRLPGQRPRRPLRASVP